MLIVDYEKRTATAGPYDVILVLKHEQTGRLHVCFAEEHPMPGPIEEYPAIVRLKSKYTHTMGAADEAEMAVQLDEMRAKILLPDENVWPEPHLPWDGEAFVTVMSQWRKSPQERTAALVSALAKAAG